MKKIICLLLALTCSFALFACGEEEGPAPEDTFISIVENSEPTKIITFTYYTEKSTEIVYKGSYDTTIDGDSFVMDYSYQEKALVTPDTVFEGSVATKTGKVYYKDGKYSADGETWFSEAPDAATLAVKLNLAKENLGTYILSDDGKTLEAQLTAENVKNLIGVTIPADSASLVITTNGTYLTGITVEYSTELADVVIATSYSYVASGEPAEAPEA